MPQRPPTTKTAPAEVLGELNLGYNGYTDPRLTNPKQWAPGSVNVYSGAFGYIQRSRFADILTSPPASSNPYTTLKYFALPALSAYLLADLGGKLFSYDTGASYAQTQRFNPYVDPAGSGSALLNGPWSREFLQNIVYEMNGQVKQSGRGANAATIEGFGLDAPDASPQVVITAGSSQTITNIQRSNGVVTVTLGALLIVPGGNGIGFINVIITAGDTSFAGTFVVQTGSGTTTLTWNQAGQNTALLTPTGTVDVNITKNVGRSYAWAWENANKVHVSAPSLSTQFILYSAQNGVIQLIEPGTITGTSGQTAITGTGTAFTAAWVGRHLWSTIGSGTGDLGRIASVQSPTSLTLAAPAPAITPGQGQFQIFDPQSTHIRLYQTADGQATYFRVQRNVFVPSANTLVAAGLQFFDNGNSEPPNFPFTTETSQLNNVPPPIGTVVNEYQGRLLVYGVPGVPQSFFYSNQETTLIGQPQESFAPLNQVTLPIANGKINGMLEFPGSLIVWSDKQDMFRVSGLLTDNTLSTAAQQGASVSRLPYNLGSANPFAMDITPLGGIWLTSNLEVWLFTDRYAPRNIGRPVQDILSTIAPAQLSLARGKYYHTSTRNWFVLAVPAFGAAYNNTLLVLDLDLLASNGSPSYFTFDMATNHPTWFVLQPGPLVNVNTITPRCDSLETVYESAGQVRLLTGCVDTSTGGSTSGKALIQDVDFQTGLFAGGGEIPVPGANVVLHAFGNDTPFLVKRPSFFRFETNRPPNTLGPEGWSFVAQGIDYDFYSFDSPLSLTLTPGVNDVATLCGNPNLAGGESFRFSPALFKVGGLIGVNFVAGRRIKFQINFPSLTGQIYQLSQVQIGFGSKPPG